MGKAIVFPLNFTVIRGCSVLYYPGPVKTEANDTIAERLGR